MVRIFVGGIPPEVDPPELKSRFSPFGLVRHCEYAKPKPQGCPGFSPIRRGFAYLEIEPKDEAAIAKCLTVYNHSRWRGHVLRVEIARPDYNERIRIEKEADEAADNCEAVQEIKDLEEAEETIIPSLKALYFPIPGRKNKFVKAPLDGSLPDGTKRAKKTFFPPVASVPLEKIEWAVLKTPKSAIKKLNELELIPSKLYVPVNQCENILVERTGVAVPMKYAPTVAKVPQVVRPKETHGYLKILKSIDAQSQKQALQEQNPTQLQAKDQNSLQGGRNQKVVDFLEDETGLSWESGAAGYAGDMHRFDDSGSEDEGRDGGRGGGVSMGRNDGQDEVCVSDHEECADEMGPEGHPGSRDWSDLEEEEGAEDEEPEGAEEDASGGLSDGGGSKGTGVSGDAAKDRGGDEESDEDRSPPPTVLPKRSGLGPACDEGPSRLESIAVAPLVSRADPPVSHSKADPPVSHSKASIQGRKGTLDLSRFGSDSEEDFKDVDSDVDERRESSRLPNDRESRQTRQKSVSQKADVKPQSEANVQQRGPRPLQVAPLSGVPLVAALSEEPSAANRGGNKRKASIHETEVPPMETPPRKVEEAQIKSSRKVRQRYCPPAVPAKPITFSFSFVGGDIMGSDTRPSFTSSMPSDGSTPLWLQCFGQGFVRSKDKSDQELRSAWDASREALVSDFKSKQRTALRHAGRGVGKRPAGLKR